MAVPGERGGIAWDGKKEERTDRKTFCSVVGVRELHPQQDCSNRPLCLPARCICLVAAIICLPPLAVSESDCTQSGHLSRVTATAVFVLRAPSLVSHEERESI